MEHRIELERVCDALTGDSHDEPAAFSDLDLVRIDEVVQKHAQVVCGDAVEVAQCEHALCELRGGELPTGRERGHDLVVEQAVGQAVQRGRLNPFLLAI